MNQKGFTLVELLIVIAIIGILSVLTVISIGSVKAKARDSIRSQDTNQLMKLFEIFYYENNGYPLCQSEPDIEIDPEAAGIVVCSSQNGPLWLNEMVPTYLNEAPLDPLNDTGDGDEAPFFYFLITDPTSLAQLYDVEPAGGFPAYLFIFKYEQLDNIDQCGTILGDNDFSVRCPF